MSPLLSDYAERFVLGCLAAIALIAGMAGLLALPVTGLLLAFRKEWPSQGPQTDFPVVAPFFLVIGGGALFFAAYREYQRRKSAQPPPVIPASPRSTSTLVAFVVLTGPVLVVTPFLYRWLAGLTATLSAEAGGLAGELSMLLAPIWVGVLLPSACLVALATTLVIAGPACLILYLGGSQRTGRILLLFWLLQLVLLVPSVPAIYRGKVPGPQGEAIGFVCVLLCAAFLGYSVPVFALWRESWSAHPSTIVQPPQQVQERCAEQPPALPLAGLFIPQNSFLVRKTGWTRFVTILPPDFVISAPAYNTGAPGLLRASVEGGLPVRTFLLESKEGPLCRIRRRTVLLKTTGYAIEDVHSRQMLFEVSRVSADGADWAVADWNQQALGSLLLRQSSLSGIDFDLLIGGVPCVRYFWRMNVLLPEVSGEWQEPVPQGFHALLAIAVGVALAHFLPEGLSRTRNWWHSRRGE
jgi:hypothetical protein